MRTLPSPLLVVTDRPRRATEAGTVPIGLSEIVSKILAGGARWVWFRERDLAAESRRVLAGEILEIVRAQGGRLSIGGDAELACRLGADGVHLPGGAGAGDIARARRLIPDGLIGVSAHSPGDVAAAARAGADYATLSPIFATASKPGYGPALGPGAVTAAAAFGIPVIALGGVTLDTVETCRDAGAAGIAVMGGLMRSRDPAGDAGALLRAGWTAGAPLYLAGAGP